MVCYPSLPPLPSSRAMTGRSRWSTFTVIVLAVTAAGLLLLAWLALRGGVQAALAAPPAFWLFVVFLAVGQVRPIVLPKRGPAEEIATSTTFTLALLLGWGLGPAALALVAGSVTGDLVARKPPKKLLFNAAQLTLAMGAAGAGRRGVLRGQQDPGQGSGGAGAERLGVAHALGEPRRRAARGDPRGDGAGRGGSGAAERAAGAPPAAADDRGAPGVQGGDRGGGEPGDGGGGGRGGARGRGRAGAARPGGAGGRPPPPGERAPQGQPAGDGLARAADAAGRRARCDRNAGAARPPADAGAAQRVRGHGRQAGQAPEGADRGPAAGRHA